MNVPSGHEIARWFSEEHALTYQQGQTAEGFDLVMEDDGYCYVWLMSFVDLDADAFFLLDVRTKTTGPETRDFLFVGRGVTFGKSVPHEWHGCPVFYGADSHDAHRERQRKGLEWFAGRIEFWTEDHAFAPTKATGEQS